MRKIIYIAAIGLAMASVTSCGKVIKIHTDKDNKVKEIAVKEHFTAIEAYNTTDIEYIDGPAKIMLSAPEKMIGNILVYVVDGKLIITQREDVKNVSMDMMMKSKLTISYPGVNSFGTYGTGDIKINTLNADSLFLNSYGTGDIESKQITCNVITALTAGTGDVEVKKLKCKEATLTSQGTGDIDIFGIDAYSISAFTNGTGDITMAGKCKKFESGENGTGDINAKRLSIGE